LIGQIERAALTEIDKLREEKLILTNALNEEIRKGNAEKRRTLELEKELAFYRGGQGTAGGFPQGNVSGLGQGTAGFGQVSAGGVGPGSGSANEQ
jgi:hypothetical protein